MNKDADDIRSNNYNNHQAKFGLSTFLYPYISFKITKTGLNFWETPTLPSPSGFTTPIAFYKSLFSLATESQYSRSRKSAFDQMKIENWSRKWCHKLAGIVVRRIGTVPFTSASSHDSKAYDPVKTELSESQAEVKNTSITMRVLRSSDRF